MRGNTARGLRALLVCQVAVSLTLLFGAVLLTRSLVRLWGIDRGFDSRGVVIVRVGEQPGAYRQLMAAAYYLELVRRLSEISGIERVSLTRQFTYVFNSMAPQQTVAVLGGGGASSEIGATVDAVSPGFFETMRIPVLQGRDFAWSDDRDSAPSSW